MGIVEFLLEKKNEKNEKIQILHLAILHFDYILNNCAALEKINESLQQKCCHNNTFKKVIPELKCGKKKSINAN